MFLKKVYLFAGLLMVASTSQAEGIKFFNGTLEQALAAAKLEEKRIFIDVMTDWCGPCKRMSEKIFSLQEVGEFYNKNFINVKLNAESEENNGLELAKSYLVDSYPTYLFLTDDGALIERSGGYMEAGAFLSLGRLGAGLGKEYAWYEERYQAGERDSEFVENLISTALAVAPGLPMEKMGDFYGLIADRADEYFMSLPESERISRSAFQVLHSAVSSRGMESSEFLLKNQDEFLAAGIDRRQLYYYVVELNDNAIEQYAKNGDSKYLDFVADMKGFLVEAYREVGTDRLPNLVSFATVDYYRTNRDWDGFVEAVKSYLAMGDEYVGDVWIMIGSLFELEAGVEAVQKIEPLATKLWQEKNRSLFSGFGYAQVLVALKDDRSEPLLNDLIALCDRESENAELIKESLLELQRSL